MVFHSQVLCQRHSCRLSPWAFHSVSSQSCLASRIVTLSVLSDQNGWWWCRCLSRSTPNNTVLCVPRWTLHLIEKSSIVSARRFQSSNRSRKYAASRRENDLFVPQITSTNPNTLDEHCVALVPTFSSLQTTMCRLWNPDKNDFRERYDFMSVICSQKACLYAVIPLPFRFASTDLPFRMTQQPCPDRFVRDKSFTAAKSHLAIRTNRPRLFPQQLGSHAQQDSMMNCASVSSRISPDLPAMFFTLFARATVARSPSHLQPYVLVKETLNEFDQSSGRVFSGLLSGLTFTLADVVFTNAKSNAITGSCSPLSRTSLRRCVSSVPRPMTHSSQPRCMR